jgi:glycosyltransferase involved in cell wall biosynthesis
LSRHADLYIAHNLAALPAAATAAARHHAKLGFDAEDYHPGELPDDQADPLELRLRRRIERELLAQCQHLTCASPMIGEAYATDYGVEMLPILNVFPLSEAPSASAPPSFARGEEPSLYWFSQTIGPNRGVEQVVRALGQMKTRAVLRLRGNPLPGYSRRLKEFALQIGGSDLNSRITLLPVSEPAEMVRLASPHDVGLAVEPGQNENNRRALSNKIFTYLLAGVPVMLSDTPAQVKLSRELGEATWVVDLNNSADVAHSLDRFFSSEKRQQAARDTAWRLARERYNWDMEQHKFLRLVEEVTLSK